MDKTKITQVDKYRIQLEDDSISGMYVFLKIGFNRSGFDAGDIDFSVTGGIERLKENFGPSRCKELCVVLAALEKQFSAVEEKE